MTESLSTNRDPYLEPPALSRRNAFPSRDQGIRTIRTLDDLQWLKSRAPSRRSTFAIPELDGFPEDKSGLFESRLAPPAPQPGRARDFPRRAMTQVRLSPFSEFSGCCVSSRRPSCQSTCRTCHPAEISRYSYQGTGSALHPGCGEKNSQSSKRFRKVETLLKLNLLRRAQARD
jgi:hypothetical protein